MGRGGTKHPAKSRPGERFSDSNGGYLHLPVRGNGDGGILPTTTTDMHTLWEAILAGHTVSTDTDAHMVRPPATYRRSRCSTGSVSGCRRLTELWPPHRSTEAQWFRA